MSQTTGKTSTYIKNANVKESTQIQTGFKNTRFLHQATAGQTLIQLNSLTTPTGVVNYSAPNVSDLSKTNLMQWGDNFRLTSSISGILIQNVSYVISGAMTIKLLYSARDGEIFEGVIDHNARTGFTLVDATPIVSSGTLAAGSTDFNVGTPFQVGLYSSMKHGAVLVYVDGQLALRNDGNAAPASGINGQYYEVHSGGGLGQIIRFNSPDLINDRAISVVSVNGLVERPNGSLMAVMESVQGQIDALVPTVAALADVAETTFQATPNNVDLKSFGDRVFTLEKILDLQIPVLTPWTSGGVSVINTTQFVTAGTGNCAKGTTVTDEVWYRQVANSLEVRIAYRQTTAGTDGTGDQVFKMPGGFTIDVNKLKVNTTVQGNGFGTIYDNNVGSYIGSNGATGTIVSGGGVMVYDKDYVRLAGSSHATASNSGEIIGAGTNLKIGNANISYMVTFSVPITGTGLQTVRQALGL